MQTVNIGDSSDRQQLLSHDVDTNTPRSSCMGNIQSQELWKGTGEPAGKAFSPSISILRTSLVTGRVVPRTRAENRKVQIGSATLYSGCE